MTASDFSQIIRSYRRNPDVAGVLSAGQRIMLAIAMCDASLLPQGYEDPVDAWRRIAPEEASVLREGMILASAA